MHKIQRNIQTEEKNSSTKQKTAQLDWKNKCIPSYAWVMNGEIDKELKKRTTKGDINLSSFKTIYYARDFSWKTL